MTQQVFYQIWILHQALFILLELFEKASRLKLNVTKTEAMWIGSCQNCEIEPLGVKWKACIKFLGIFITYDVQLLVEKIFEQRLKKIKNTINLWKARGLSIHGKVNIIKTLLLPKMIYASSVICTPPDVIKKFNTLVFHFLWNGKDKVTRLSTYAPYDQRGLKMLDYDTMIKSLRLSWLKRIVDPEYSNFWKVYLNYLLRNEGGLFLIQCNYGFNQIILPKTFYRELLEWWSQVREIEDPNNIYKYILWNNKETKIEDKSVFYKHFFDNNIKYTADLLYDMSNITSLNVVRGAGLKCSNFLTWTGLRQSDLLELRCNMPNLKVIFDLENFKCCDCYFYLIKQIYEKPSNWRKLKEEFNLEDKQVSEAFVMPLRVANEPYYAPFSIRF